MTDFDKNYWAIILGGSSGFGLATAKKLSQHGMNICIVHRDRRGAMKRIEPEFENIRKTGVQFIACNTNALSPEGIDEVLTTLQEKMAGEGVIRLMLHSIAFGNLKLMTPQTPASKNRHAETIAKLSEALNIMPEKLQTAVNQLFEAGNELVAGVATPATYNNEEFLRDEDFAQTIYSMGSNMASWVQAIFERNMFADDARVLGMTSEGNDVAWRGYAAVSAAKVTMEAIARSIAVEYAPYGIRANIIQAGVTDTPALRLIPGNTHLKATAKARNPFKRLTTPEDVADFIYLMARDEAAWANGNIIRVDGGEHISG